MKVHVGAGATILPGWVNVDVQPYPGIDHVLDVTGGLPFQDVEFIFAEHFLEHLDLPAALNFMGECRKVLNSDGILRLSTPNLDWIWTSHYRRPDTLTADEALTGCLEMNRAFHGWGHKFIYNAETIKRALRSVGFEKIEFCAYGESRHAELRALERHPKSNDLPSFPHVLIVEASGIGPRTDEFRNAADEYIRDFEVK